MREERSDGRVPSLAVEPPFRPLEAEDAGEATVGAEDGSGDRVEVALALARRLRPAVRADALDCGSELGWIRHGSSREAFEAAGRKSGFAKCERHLSGRGGVGNARAAEPRDALDRRGALREVDGDRVALARDRERGGLACLLDERFQVGTRHRTEVEPAERRVAEL